MRDFLLRIIINTIAIAITAALLPGITILTNDFGSLILIGLVIAIVNAFVRPIVALLTCPFVILSLGLFIFVINGLMLMITAGLLPERLVIDGFGWALLGGIMMALANMVIEGLLGVEKKNQTTIIIDR